MFTLIFSSLLQTTQSVSFNQSSSNPALPALQLAEKQLYNARQRNPRLNSLAWAHPSLAWALIKTKIFPAVWIKHPQSWATRQDCSTATGRCQFAAQVSTLGISPFSSNQKINSSHSTQANYFFFAWKRQPNSLWRTKGKCDLWAKYIHHNVMDGSGNAARSRRHSQHRRCCQQLPPNVVWETAVISCSKGKAKPLVSQLPRSCYCWQRGVLTPGGYSWRRQRSPSPRGMQLLRVTQKTTNHPKKTESWPEGMNAARP